MGHPQPPTSSKFDNTTAEDFSKGTLKQKISKAIDMRFTGSRAAKPRAGSTYFGAQEKTTLVITKANTIPWPTTA